MDAARTTVGGAIDLASRSMRLNASGEEMSGFEAPRRTATAAMELARSVAEPGEILPACLRRSRLEPKIMMTSTVSPDSIRHSIP
jgi:hypothetical protein